MADDDKNEPEQPIIVKKIVAGHGHHGGAWKVAYADFVTAMMAFFLLLWLLSVSVDEELKEISNYFDPTFAKISETTSGAGGVLSGLSVAPDGALVSDVQDITSPRPSGAAINNKSSQKSTAGQVAAEDSATGLNKRSGVDQSKAGQNAGKSQEQTMQEQALERAKEEMRKQEQKKFEDTKAQIEKMIKEDPSLSDLSENLVIDITPEGLRIQLIDTQGRPLFASGSARMTAIAKVLISKVTGIIIPLPNELSIKGHTDGTPYGVGATYTNWELSADRANSARREVLENEFPTERVHNVVGKADSEHMFPENPTDQRNRRISITLMREELTNPEKFNLEAEEAATEALLDAEEGTEAGQPTAIDTRGPVSSTTVPIGTFRRTQGAVEFP